MNPAANGECQAWTNLNWGQQAQGTQVNPDVQEGWGKRNWDWQFSAGVQHEVLPRVSVDVSYSRRWWGNFFVTHNRALGPQDYDEVTLTAPSDSRLPGGGGYPVAFLVRNNNSVLGVSDPYYTTTKDFGDETHYWHGVEISANARLGALLVQGGTSTGRGVNDTCDVLIGRYGRPMAPGGSGVRERPAGLQRRRTVAHDGARAGVIHGAEGRRACQRHHAIAGERPAGRGRCHEWRVAGPPTT